MKNPSSIPYPELIEQLHHVGMAALEAEASMEAWDLAPPQHQPAWVTVESDVQQVELALLVMEKSLAKVREDYRSWSQNQRDKAAERNRGTTTRPQEG